MACIVYNLDQEERRRLVFTCSGLTHGHGRSKIACWLFSEIVAGILKNHSKESAIETAYTVVGSWCADNQQEIEWRNFSKCTPEIAKLSRESIQSTGYVVHSLEASLYTFLTTESIADAVLNAVNLGGDTDTIAAITGSLSGAFYGYQNIPQTWRSQLKRIDDIDRLTEKFCVLETFGIGPEEVSLKCMNK
jgi:ADP-ribosylglycohydrolase